MRSFLKGKIGWNVKNIIALDKLESRLGGLFECRIFKSFAIEFVNVVDTEQSDWRSVELEYNWPVSQTLP